MVNGILTLDTFLNVQTYRKSLKESGYLESEKFIHSFKKWGLTVKVSVSNLSD